MFQSQFPQAQAHTMQIEQQTQRHEIAKLRQLVSDWETYINTIHFRLASLGTMLQTNEQQQEYVQLLVELNRSMESLNNHRTTLSSMLSMINNSYTKTIPDQCRREIYHLYHAGRYTQEQLAGHYGTSQSAVSKIVNGTAPAPINGVNPQGIAG